MTFRSKLVQLLFAAVILFNPFRSAAWGVLGHRIVGAISSNYLTPRAAGEVQKILGTETIALASTWADFIKSDTNYRYLSEWHYIDVDSGLSFARFQKELDADTAANAYSRLIFLANQLKNKQLSASNKKMYLRLLIHIVGDIHQPFHVSAKGDRGGNDIKVTWFGQNSNIHRVWDEQLIEMQQLSYTEYVKAINFASLKQQADWQKEPIKKWFFDTYTISEKLHNDLKNDQKLSYRYNFDNIDILNKQLLKGGIHLAALLNQIFI